MAPGRYGEQKEGCARVLSGPPTGRKMPHSVVEYVALKFSRQLGPSGEIRQGELAVQAGDDAGHRSYGYRSKAGESASSRGADNAAALRPRD